MADKIIQIDSVDAYNKLYGEETLHPLVGTISHETNLPQQNHLMMNWGYMGYS